MPDRSSKRPARTPSCSQGGVPQARFTGEKKSLDETGNEQKADVVAVGILLPEPHPLGPASGFLPKVNIMGELEREPQ